MVKSFGSSTDSDNDDDDDEETSNGPGNAAKTAAAGEAAAATADGKPAKEVWTSGKEREVGNGEGGSPKEEQGDVAGGRSLGGDGNEERQQQATEEAEGGEQVRGVKSSQRGHGLGRRLRQHAAAVGLRWLLL
jgi:hypothetical protein